MKKIIIFASLIFFSSCNRQAYEARLERKGKIKCGWYGKMTTEQRRKTFPFSEADKIVLVSYPNYATNYVYEEITTPWGEKLPGMTVEKYIINQPIIDTLKIFHRRYLVYEKEELNQNQIDSLSHVYFNYTQNRKTKFSKISMSCCYKPRNSIIIYNKKGIPIFNFEICFQCPGYEISINSEEKNGFLFYDKCMDYELYKVFFKQCQIHYGIDTP